MRRSCTASIACASRRSSSRTSARTTSTSTATWSRTSEAKRRLFLEGGPPAAVNVGDAWGRRLAEELPDALTFGFSEDAAVGPDALAGVSLRLRGRFNVENALGALAAGRLLGDRGGGDPARARVGARGAGTLRVRRRGPAVPRDRRLRAQARRPRERPPRRARPGRRKSRPVRARRGRRPGSRQATADGEARVGARRPRDRHLGQPAQRGSGGDHRGDRRGRGRRGGGRARPRRPRSPARSGAPVPETSS